MKRTFLLLAMAASIGCSRKAESAQMPENSQPQRVTFRMAGDPAAALIVVDGVRLTRATATQLADQQMAAIKSQVPPERIPEVKQRVFDDVVNQFVMRTLLLKEAERRHIAATPEDEAKAFDQIRASLPPGLTPEGVMQKSAIGEAKMREEVLIGIRINKLLASEPAITNVTVAEQEVSRYIDEHKGKLDRPETVHARHILVAVRKDDTEETRSAKRARAENLRQQILAGKEFADIAGAHSDCKSRIRGGDLGTFRRGQMAKAFEDAAFSQKVSEVGPVVETDSGYHIIQVLQHNAAGPVSRDEVTKTLLQKKRRQAIIDFADRLKSRAKIVCPSP